MDKSKDILAFAHIEKTAGTTVSRRLRMLMGSNHLDIKPWKPKMNKLSSKDLEKILFYFPWVKSIAGHSVKPSEELISEFTNLRFYTFLRNPVDRIISLYVHRFEKNKTAQINFKDWYFKKCIDNWQVQFIAGNEDLQRACEIIQQHFIYVGIAESFEACWKEFSGIAGVPYINNIDRSSYNMTANKELKEQLKADPEIVEFILSKNKLDNELHQLAKNKQLQTATLKNTFPISLLNGFKINRNKLMNAVNYNVYRTMLFLSRLKNI